jgi:beta-lactamase regulating signal transducer with metallopeptidase domain
MSASVLATLVELTVATSIAVLIVAIARWPVRRLAGAGVAYWLWALVPASVVAVSLPAPLVGMTAVTPFAGTLRDAVPVQAYVEVVVRPLVDWAAIAMVVWASGAVLVFAVIVRRQRAFVRSLGTVRAGGDGFHRSAGVRGPVLVGLWRPRIVVPTDFETRYGAEERALMLAHERAHARRLDVPVNCLAAACLCLFWFNPLAHWAVARLRVDQELACDAVVLRESRVARRRYADALLRTQLADDASRTPVACRWQSVHPLKERIAMLGLPLPTSLRRLAGAALTTSLVLACCYGSWLIDPELALAQGSTPTAPSQGTIILTPGERTDIRTPPGAVLTTPDGQRMEVTSGPARLTQVTKITIHADNVALERNNGEITYSGNVVLEFSTSLDRPLAYLPDRGAERIASSFTNAQLNIFSPGEPITATSASLRRFDDGSFVAERLRLSMAGYIVSAERAVIDPDGSIKADSIHVETATTVP